MTIARTADLAPHTTALIRWQPALTAQASLANKPVQADTSVHPIAVAIPLAAAAWFVVVAWAAFGGGETSLVLGVITFLVLMFFGLFVGCGAKERDMTPDRKHGRSFQEFLNGDVDIATGRIGGREALWQIATMPIALAIGFTVIAVIAATA
jgi:hypothetical protein